jgi:hypothetical protein
MQGQCKPNAESSLYAEVQPVLACRRQSYDENPLIANISAFISPTYSDNRPQRRQISQTPSKIVHSICFLLIYLFVSCLFRTFVGEM